MKILHIEMGRHLYGGARQVAYLLNGLSAQQGAHVLVCAEDGEIAAAIHNPAVRVQPLPFHGDLDVAAIPRLRRIIRTERPDLIHIHSRRGDMLAALAGRLEQCLMIHSRRVDNPPSWFDLKVKFPLFARIVTISQGIRTVLLEAGVSAQRVLCIPSAVDADHYRPGCDRQSFVRELGLSAEDIVLAVIAQLIPRKGHAVLFQALPEIVRRYPQVRVLLFGQGPLSADLQRQVQQRGLQAHVYFLGFRDDLDRLLPCFDLVVHPAWMEGLGVSLLEAAACGVPIVACRSGGIPEAVVDGVTGLLVEPGDHIGLHRAILDLLDHPERRRAFGHAGRAWVLKHFSIARMVQDNHAAYLSVLAEHAAKS